ncbi:MAG: hypothetical protein ACXAC8_06095 [Candidatus Hodarchaeales archaeon]|jgi:hypothetical protein
MKITNKTRSPLTAYKTGDSPYKHHELFHLIEIKKKIVHENTSDLIPNIGLPMKTIARGTQVRATVINLPVW